MTAGVRHGRTLGSPVAMWIENRDYQNWEERMNPWPVEADVEEVHLPRPGHADLAGIQKFGHTDVRNVLERASAPRAGPGRPRRRPAVRGPGRCLGHVHVGDDRDRIRSDRRLAGSADRPRPAPRRSAGAPSPARIARPVCRLVVGDAGHAPRPPACLRPGRPERDRLLRLVQLTVNGIAAGLQRTG